MSSFSTNNIVVVDFPCRIILSHTNLVTCPPQPIDWDTTQNPPQPIDWVTTQKIYIFILHCTIFRFSCTGRIISRCQSSIDSLPQTMSKSWRIAWSPDRICFPSLAIAAFYTTFNSRTFWLSNSSINYSTQRFSMPIQSRLFLILFQRMNVEMYMAWFCWRNAVASRTSQVQQASLLRTDGDFRCSGGCDHILLGDVIRSHSLGDLKNNVDHPLFL